MEANPQPDPLKLEIEAGGASTRTTARPAAQHYLSMAAFGLAIGALGGFFGEESYFRHVAFADGET